MFAVEVQNDHGYAVSNDRLVAAAAEVLTAHGAPPDAAVTIVIADDETVAALNRHYRGVEGPTDVLSFPAVVPPLVFPGEPAHLGDLVIAYPYTVAQAKQLGHSLEDSLVLLVVHGTLHLLGFDHDTEASRAAMWHAQAQALAALGISTDLVPALEESAHGE